MELKSWLTMMLFILGNISSSSAGLGLGCYTDCETMFCRFQPLDESCNDYSLSFNEKEEDCVLQWCDSGLCCCSAGFSFVIGETYNATVSKRGKIMEVKVIDLISSLKPKTPTITSVSEFNGNFEVKWRTNMENCPLNEYSAEVAYWKKGDKQVTKHLCIKPPKVEGSSYYCQIQADLEPSTTYVVSLRSVADLNDSASNCSEEWEFTVAARLHSPLIIAVISLSIAAAVVPVAIFCCYGKLKATWKNSVAMCPMPVILEMRLGNQEILKPTEVTVCPVIIDPVVQKDAQTSLADPSNASRQQSVEVGARSFSFSSVDIEAEMQKARREKLGHLLLASSVDTSQPTGPNTDSRFPFDVSINNSHSSPECLCFDNLTYSSLAGSKHRSSENKEIFIDSVYHCNEDITGEKHAPTRLASTEEVIQTKGISPLVTTDLSCQIFSVDSGRFSQAKENSLSSISCDNNSTTSCDHASSVEGACESPKPVVMKLNDKNEDDSPYYRESCLDHNPTGPLIFPNVDQPFQDITGQPSVLFSEEKSDQDKKCLE